MKEGQSDLTGSAVQKVFREMAFLLSGHGEDALRCTLRVTRCRDSAYPGGLSDV